MSPDHLRTAPDPGLGGDIPPVSVPDPRLSLRQGFGVPHHTVAKLLNKLLVEFTKSRSSQTTDNALVEGKNGAVVRKHIGYGPIPPVQAEAVQKFYTAYFTPYEKLASLPKWEPSIRGEGTTCAPAF
jgi:hypothetical protein